MIEIWEYEVFHRVGKHWIEDTKHPWTLKSTNDVCKPPDEITLPNSEWVWTSNWKIDKRPGETDGDGWEYASKSSRFIAGKARTAKAEKAWSDKSRRRLWARLMRREVNIGKGADLTKVMPKIQQGLSSIHTARLKIEDICKQSPESAGTDQMQVLVHSVKKNIADIMMVLDQVDEQSSSKQGGSGPNNSSAVVKKLRNDVLREEIAIEKALNPASDLSKNHAPLGKKSTTNWFSTSASSSSGGGMDGGVGSSTGRGSFSQNGLGSYSGSFLGGGIASASVGDRNSFNAGRQSFNGNSFSMAGRTSNMSTNSNSSMGTTGPGKPTVSGLSELHLEAIDAPEKTPSSPEKRKTTAAPVKGGGASSFTPAALVRGNSGYGSDLGGEAEDGVFVDKTQQELQIESKFIAIDEATVMAEIIEERAEAITQINKGIVDLNEMFVDLSKIVKMQDVSSLYVTETLFFLHCVFSIAHHRCIVLRSFILLSTLMGSLI